VKWWVVLAQHNKAERQKKSMQLATLEVADNNQNSSENGKRKWKILW